MLSQPIEKFKVKRVRSSRSLKLRVYDDGSVVVTAPPHVRQPVIEGFIEQHRGWIETRLEQVIKQQQALILEKEGLLFRGKQYHLRLGVSSARQASAKFVGDTLLVSSPTENHAEVRRLIEKLYRKLASAYFGQRVPLLGDLVGKDISNVTIRSQRTRWGSCSSRNTISLNWRLIMAPDWVSDYVIYHELAHLTQMNHSKAFWQLVAAYHKRYKEAEKWLKQHHSLLKF